MKKILAFNYFGGKYQFLEQLYQYFPAHAHFLDLFCGSMSVTLNKKPSKLDTANDIDGSVVNFFKVLRDNPDELMRVLTLTPVSRLEYNNCFPIYIEGISEVEWARRFYVRCRMSFQGSGLKQHTGFNTCINSTQGGRSKNVSKYINSLGKLGAVADRLRQIQIEQLDYRKCLEKYDTMDTLIYVDPPYELRRRNYKKWYNHEFEQDSDHIELGERLNSCQAKIMVSGYNSPLYKQIYENHGWIKIQLKPRKHSMKNAKKQEEFVWINYQLEKTTLF